MPVYSYKAFGDGRQEISGTLVADTPRAARDNLRAQGLSVQEMAEQTARLRSRSPRSLLGVPCTHVIGFYRELATLLAVGIPLLEAMATVARQHEGTFKSVILQIRERVSAGLPLAQAMAEHPRIFDSMACSIVEVGESAGTLDQSLEQLAQYRERSSQLKGRIGTALAYPAIVLCMGIGVALFMMAYVVPNLLTVIADSGRQLPVSTRIVKTVSDLLIDYWWLLAALVAGLGFAAAALTRSQAVRWALHRLELRLPLVGDLVRKQAIVRVAMAMALLLRSGLTFIAALQLAQRVTRNSLVRQALIDCERAIYAGTDIAAALEASPAARLTIPPTVVQVFAVGQESGQLEAMLERLSKDYDQQLQVSAQRLTSLLEPLMIILLAIVVAFIAFATIMPILEVSDVL